jgi:glucitol/sorbitol PTS system EIIA component
MNDMKTIYQSRVTEIGSQVGLFLEDKMMILFNESAPVDLRDIAIVHNHCSLEEDIKVGDELVIDNQSFKITSVGSKVNETMRDLGHSTVAFNGSTESEMPGTICVEKKEIPPINVSSQLMFRQLR